MPTLSDQEIYDVVFSAFGDLGSDTCVIMGAICLAESGGDTEAVGDNYESGHQTADSPYRWDSGLAQINSIHNFDSQLLINDPAYNLSCARAIYNYQGFQAWSTFKGGQFRAFIPRMEATVEGLTSLPVVPPPFSREDLILLYFQLYGYPQNVIVEPDGFEFDGRRRYKLVIR